MEITLFLVQVLGTHEVPQFNKRNLSGRKKRENRTSVTAGLAKISGGIYQKMAFSVTSLLPFLRFLTSSCSA
jgi:hypothetical protein